MNYSKKLKIALAISLLYLIPPVLMLLNFEYDYILIWEEFNILATKVGFVSLIWFVVQDKEILSMREDLNIWIKGLVRLLSAIFFGLIAAQISPIYTLQYVILSSEKSPSFNYTIEENDKIKMHTEGCLIKKDNGSLIYILERKLCKKGNQVTGTWLSYSEGEILLQKPKKTSDRF